MSDDPRNLPSLSSLALPVGPLPEFTNTIDAKYKCVACKGVLQEPIQTPCGHRLCKVCWEGVIQGQDSARCPANEDECSVVTAGDVYPDFSARKEISKFPVYCKHKPDGCDVIVPWAKLKIHLDQDCEFSYYECPFRCGEKLHGPTHLETHRESECPNRPKASVEMKENFEKLSEETKTLSRWMKQVKDRIDVLEKRQRDILVSTANFGEQVKMIEGRTATFCTKAELNTHLTTFRSLQQNVQENTTKLRQLENKGTSGVTGGEVGDSIRRHERQLAITEVRLAEGELRMLSIESTNYSGHMIWKISDYRNRKMSAAAPGGTLSLYSQPFFTSRYGYKMCARAYLNGDGVGRGTHCSMFFVIQRGEYDNLLDWPFRLKVTLTLLDQTNGKRPLSDTFRPDPNSSSFRKPISDMNVASGCPLFVQQSVLEAAPYMKDDCFFIKVSVEIGDLAMP